LIDPESETVPARAGRDPDLAAGGMVGRYRLIDLLGEGGMGVVWSAHDPELDRTVAIKLVRGRASEEYRRRLQREAQVMARLSHPDILPVHDVGRHRGDVFLAMELVRGRTGAAWLAEARPGWRDALTVLVRAGRGLAAAHDAGVIHRDFKPSNVLIGDDGRVRVSDFGLARLADEPPSDSGGAAARDLDVSITGTGAVMGTPAYMAPEQHVGRRADARSDQFAFCVALYEAVYGARPFAPPPSDLPPLAALTAEVTAGRVQPPPAGSQVPGWLRAIVVRGLAVDPDERWPSMKALLDELERTPVRRRRAAAAAVSAITATGIAAGLWAAWPAREVPPDPCAQLPAEMPGWDAARANALRARFAASGAPSGGAIAATVVARLDAYRGQLGAMRLASCRATHTTGEQTEATAELRARCLDRRSDAARVAIDMLSRAGADEVSHALDVLANVPPVAECADVEELAAIAPLPDDPAARKRISELTAQIDQIDATFLAGHMPEALAQARAALDPAIATGYAPLEAEARSQLGTYEAQNGDHERAAALLEQAVLDARAGGDGIRELTSMLRLALAANTDSRYDDAAHWLGLADSTLVAMHRHAAPGALVKYDMELALQQAEVAAGRSRWDEARERFARAIAAAKVAGDEYDEARIRYRLGTMLEEHGEVAAARPEYERSLAIFQAELGDSPMVANMTALLGANHAQQGDLAGGRALLERALALQEKAIGPDAEDTANIAGNLGAAILLQGDPEGARPYLERAIASLDRPGRAPLGLAEPLDNLSTVELAAGHAERAQALVERELALVEGVEGKDSRDLAGTLYNLARIQIQRERWADALATATRGRALADAAFVAQHPLRAYGFLHVLGVLHAHAGRAKEAAAELDAAIAGVPISDNDQAELAEIRADLAPLAWQLGDHARALQLARAARATLATAGAAHAGALKSVDAFLAAHAK
jgi:tetratricopeptide (TPR) repeat protein